MTQDEILQAKDHIGQWDEVVMNLEFSSFVDVEHHVLDKLTMEAPEPGSPILDWSLSAVDIDSTVEPLGHSHEF